MADKVTIMVLKVVDLHCYSCYKKIKKVLCKFPEIRNQVYDEKANTVTITVICCNPEKIRDKLYCKGRKTITRIDIKPLPTPTPTPKPVVEPVPTPTPTPKPVPTPTPTVPVRECCVQCYDGHFGGPCYQWYGRPVPCYDGYGYEYRYCEKKICYVSRCDYFNEENTLGCTIM